MTGDSEVIYYFGYGPIVNPLVRKRRGVDTCDEEAAMLPEYRLTFAYGGIVSAIRQRGYEVHGVLMKFRCLEDWNKFQEFDAGLECDTVDVFPYRTPDEPIRAHVFFMKDFDEKKLDEPIEILPQERYLKLIAQGMRCYNLDDDYIEDQILAIPYIPSRKPENYYTFPVARQREDSLPRITLRKYERLCRSTTSDLYFILGDSVFQVGPHDSANPGAVWLRERAHGQPDITFFLHKLIVDPEIPFCETEEEITSLHVAWAENHLVEWMQNGGMAATKVFILSENLETSSKSMFALCCPSIFRRKSSARNPTDEVRTSFGSDQSPADDQPSSMMLVRQLRHGVAEGDTDNSSRGDGDDDDAM